ARRDHAHRNTAALHRVNLDRGSLRTKRKAVRRVERVLPASRRMVFRNVERAEVVEVSLDLAIIFNRIAERDENVFQLLAQERDRMAMSEPRPAARQSDVDTLARSAFVLDIVFKTLLRLIQRLDKGCFS